MSFHGKEVLETSLCEFAAGGPPEHLAYVADQEASEGRDSGLVIYPLRNATTSVFIQPVSAESREWRVTIKAQPDVAEFTPEAAYDLCRELQRAADLCAFLRAQTDRCSGVSQ